MHSDMNKIPIFCKNTDLVLGTIHNHSNYKFSTRMEQCEGPRSPLIRRDSDVFEAQAGEGYTEVGEEPGS